jgi:hypothetical protein
MKKERKWKKKGISVKPQSVKAAVVEKRLDGESKAQIANELGIAPKTVGRILDEPQFYEVVRKAIPPEKIAKRLREGLNAKETQFFQKDGIVTDHRDVISWSERRQYLQLAAEFGGYHRPGEAPLMAVNFNFDGLPPLGKASMSAPEKSAGDVRWEGMPELTVKPETPSQESSLKTAVEDQAEEPVSVPDPAAVVNEVHAQWDANAHDLGRVDEPQPFPKRRRRRAGRMSRMPWPR